MKEITVNGNDYKLEFSFEAAERKDFVSMMFRIVSGAALLEDCSKPGSIVSIQKMSALC